MKRSEIAFALIFVIFTGAFVFADRSIPRRGAGERGVSTGRFISTAWYCPGPGGDGFDPVMSTTNLGDVPVRLRRLAVGTGSASAFEEGVLGSHRRAPISVLKFGVKDAAGLTEAFGASTFTDLATLVPGKGAATSTCSVQPSNRWLFASGSTARGESHHLLVSNPFEEEAVIKVRFITEDKDVVPARLKDLVVGARTQLDVSLADFFAETPSFGLDVTATQGRVVVSRFSQVSTRSGVKGLSLAVGARSPSVGWIIAGGEVPGDGEEFIVLVNPESSEALVQLVFQLEGEQSAPPGLGEIALKGGTQLRVKASDHLPRGSKYAVKITSANAVPIVAERETVAATAGGRGYESVFAVREPSARWAVGIGSLAGGSALIAISNPSSTVAVVRIGIYREATENFPAELAALKVAAGRRSTVDLTGFLEGGAGTALLDALVGTVAVEAWLVLGPPYADFAGLPGHPLE